MVMLALVTATGAAALITSQMVIGRFTATAQELEATGAYTARLGKSMLASEGITHALFAEDPAPPQVVLARQRAVDAEFAAGFAMFDEPRLRDALTDVQQSWHAALAEVGVLGPQVLEFKLKGEAQDAHELLADGADEAIEKLAVIDDLARDELGTDLADAQQFHQLALAVVIGVVCLALFTILYFARRMSRDVLYPVEALRQGVGRVRAGELDHRVELSDHEFSNELTDLAAGFNEMAGELDTTQRELTFRALHDSLTGLPNRLGLHQHLAAQFANRDGLRDQPDISVLFVDLDDFKVVNDTLGHAGGDELLKEVAERLAASTRGTDFVARLGGDEFAIVVTTDGKSGAAVVAERALAALSTPFIVQGQSLSVGASIGVGTTQPDTTSAEELLGNADFAMYMAKGQGKRRYEVYDPSLHAATTDHASLRSDLRKAVDNGELCLDYQPIMDMSSGTIVGLEALLRWNHPIRGLVAPMEFIPLAEQTGDIDDIGLWVLRTATNQLAQWRQTGATHADLWISVNLSPVQLHNPSAVARLVKVLSAGPVPADAVILEITETALVLGVEGSVDALQILKDTGARIALDDFGTGLTSLNTLAGLPVDILKIDQAFVSGQGDGLPSTHVLHTVTALAANLRLDVIAEGVEDDAQINTLQEQGCHMGQGFGLIRPTAPAPITELLLNHLQRSTPA